MDWKKEHEATTSHEIHNVQAEKLQDIVSDDALETKDAANGGETDVMLAEELKRSLSNLSDEERVNGIKSTVSLPEADVTSPLSPKLLGIDLAENSNNDPSTKTVEQTNKPFGIASLREIIRFLSSLITSHHLIREKQPRVNTDAMRLLGIRLISVAVKEAGPRLSQFPSIMTIIRNEILCSIFQLLESTENLFLMRHGLRTCLDLFISLMPQLKCQLEFHLTLLLDRLVALHVPRLKTLELQESILEHFYQLCKIPNFICSLYVNFDCDVQFSNVYENWITYLYKNMVSDTSFNNQLTHVHILCLDIIVEILKSLVRISSNLEIDTEIVYSF